jgi:putative addiction module CopG family antidote
LQENIDPTNFNNVLSKRDYIYMATERMNISLPPELKASIETRVRSDLYGNASDMIRADLRALAREELGSSVSRFEEILATLPQEPITEKIEEKLRALRGFSRRKLRK